MEKQEKMLCGYPLLSVAMHLVCHLLNLPEVAGSKNMYGISHCIQWNKEACLSSQPKITLQDMQCLSRLKVKAVVFYPQKIYIYIVFLKDENYHIQPN